ncbi:hypothetical protein SAMN05216302_101651 [Nitrosomonas aestuarii]|uniref:Uncharacterized protein n=1 Tax=Nitrosomonas aestuarii TaxID=52441 RepID=A0A1I4CNI1_9PROT|nr:hypothetical protein C8R11_12512 [Nitrosomonas aestuarii]SFK81809.1 hypothetical protein SAMN05216302_101651 [Nitrosomonas aestuarii]
MQYQLHVYAKPLKNFYPALFSGVSFSLKVLKNVLDPPDTLIQYKAVCLSRLS